MRLGDLTVWPVRDGSAVMSADEAFGTAADRVRAVHPETFTADGRFEFPIGAFLVTGRDRVVLVDAGAGPRDSWVTSGRLLDELRAAGVEARDVTDIVYTHLHWDHVGWTSQRGEPIFENASHHCHQDDWEHFFGNQPGATKRLTPVADRMHTWSSDHTVLPGLDVLHTPGHTPGHSAVTVSGAEGRVLLLGDAVHCPVQLSEPDVGFVSDVDGALARRSREVLAAELVESGVEAVGAHFTGLRFGRLVEGETGTRWVWS